MNKRLVTCKKSLYKNTYKGYAFIAGQKYPIEKEEDNTFFLMDEQGKLFNFSNKPTWPFYSFSDYFDF